MPAARSVALVSLGCARNEVDSEELAARLEAGGWRLAGAGDADAVVVNTCGFVEAAKKDSVDTLLAAADTGAAVVAVGCLAERYGGELSAALPEATVLSFDDYADISDRLDDVLAGRRLVPHRPRDRRTLLPIGPAQRSDPPGSGDLPPGVAPASGPRVMRRRLDGGPVAPLKLASGCDRRCAFCAIPAFRGAFRSRPPGEILAEASWLADRGVRELVLVSENSTSYGKDLGDLRLLESLLPELTVVPGISRVRVSYLQPAEMRDSLVDVLTSTPGVAPYFDLSFQHASGPVLRRMRRFGDRTRFLDLLAAIRQRCPDAGVRSNVIVGFPGETAADLAELEEFLVAGRLDAVGVFGYSDEDGTEAAGLPGHIPADIIGDRRDRISRLAEELTAQRAQDRLASVLDVLVESVDGSEAEGRAAHQGPEVDGSTVMPSAGLAVGDLVRVRVTASAGVDLRGEIVGDVPAAAAGLAAAAV